jgi:riboflavin synthase
MFTGIVTDVGEVLSVTYPAEGLRRLSIACRYDRSSMAIGASIACAGVCMTIVATNPGARGAAFEVEAAAETLAITTVGQWTVGRKINLERALRLGDELGGHLVSGHVDGRARVIECDARPEMVRFTCEVPQALSRFIARKGSVALDGVSLTVNDVDGCAFSVLLIPHTLSVTTLGDNRPGDWLNVEIDVMARYAARLIEHSTSSKDEGAG